MTTEKTKDGGTILIPDKGMYLVKDGIYSDSAVYLSSADKAENWTETSEKPDEPVSMTVDEELADAKAAFAAMGIQRETTWEAAVAQVSMQEVSQVKKK
jgi:hypothetical protein